LNHSGWVDVHLAVEWEGIGILLVILMEGLRADGAFRPYLLVAIRYLTFVVIARFLPLVHLYGSLDVDAVFHLEFDFVFNLLSVLKIVR